MNKRIKGIINVKNLALLSAVMLMTLGSASATVYVKDGVPIGTTGYKVLKLPGQSTTTNAIIGCSGSWSGSTGVLYANVNNLSYPDAVNLISSGGSFSISHSATAQTTGRTSSRSISGSGLPASGSLYFSTLIKVDATALSNLANNQAYYVGITTTDYNASDASVVSFPASGVFVGFKKVSGVVTVSLGVNGTSYVLVPSVTADQTYFCVVEIQLNTGAGGEETVTAVVDPLVAEMSGTYSATTSAANVVSTGSGFTHLTVGGLYATGGGSAYWDEILVADSLSEVAPIDASFPFFTSSPTVLPNESDQMIFSATLGGGSASTETFACYGTTVGGSTLDSWDHYELLSASPTIGVPESMALTLLAADTSYYFAAGATNSTSSAIEMGSTFLNGEVWATAGSDAEESGLVPGSILVHRPASATQAPLAVNYSLSGSAVEGLNYNGAALTGTITIPAGQATASIVIEPLFDNTTTTDTTLIVTLESGAYFISTSDNEASIDIQNATPPVDKNVWVGSGNASNPANWSKGVPQAGDDILLSIYSIEDLVWDVDGINGLTDTVASWTQDALYTGTVTFPIQYDTVSGATFTNFTVTGDVVIDAGSWTHTANTSAQDYHLQAKINGTLTVGTNGTISALGKGYYNGGKNNGCHGGNANNVVGSTYGDPKYPTDIGACINTSAGGGAILLNVTGAVVINGAITSSGITANTLEGGAGGSVLLAAPSITGSGSITANGAMGNKTDWYGNAGSGGRIALLTDSVLAFPTNQVTAYGRATGEKTGYGTGAGTIFLKHTGEANGTLVVYNFNVGQNFSANGFKSFGVKSVTPINEGETWTFDRILTQGFGVLSIPVGTTLVLPNGLASVSSLDTVTPVRDGLRYDGGTLDIGTSSPQVISGGWCFQAARPYTITGDLEVLDGASVGICRLRQLVSSSGITNYLGCDLRVTGDMTVDSTSFIEARYSGFWDSNAEFPTWTHGGVSGYSTNSAHDSILSPYRPAGGKEYNESAYAGGGVIKLTVGGNLQLDGKANAEGIRESSFIDLDISSAGGTLNFTLGSLSGGGSISANGGINTRRMGSGGGRIAIRLTDPGATFDAWNSKITAIGRIPTETSDTKSGSAGTIYLQTAADGENAGVIVVKNDNKAANMIQTPIPATGADADTAASLKAASLSLERCGRVVLAANLKLAALDIETDSSIDLAGYTLTLTDMKHDGLPVPAGTYAAADFVSGVIDASAEVTGRIVVLGQSTLFMIR